MPSTNTAAAAAAVPDRAAVAPTDSSAAPADTGALAAVAEGEGVLDRLRDRDRSSGPSATPPAPSSTSRPTATQPPGARYVGRAYLDRRFLFSLDFGPGAWSEQRQADDPPAFEDLATDSQAHLDTAVAVADAAAPPPGK